MVVTPALALHLQSLKGNPGILPVKEGEAYLQTDQWTIIKVVNLEGIYDDLNFVISKYNEFSNLVKKNESYPPDFLNIVAHIEYLREITIQKYRQLVPQQRFKRGIIDPLGSLIKIVTGNLDHSDALRYDKITSELGHNQIIIKNKLTLVSAMLDSFINTTEVLNQNSAILQERLKIVESMFKEIKSKTGQWAYTTYTVSLFNIFASNFRTIYLRLGEIETALTFSKISMLHPSVVNSTELLQHLKLISNTVSLIYPVTDENLVKLEETINVKTYLKNNQITFILEIPLTDNNTYNYYKIYSLPVFREVDNKTVSILPKYPHLLAKGMKHLPIVKPCRPLAAGDQFLCAEHNQAPYSEPTCIGQLLKFEDNLTCCKQQEISIEDVRVQRITATSWILFTRLKTVLTSYCNNEINKHPVFGTYILTLNEPCQVEIRGIRIYQHQIFTETENAEPIPAINLPELPAHSTQLLSSTRVLNMHGINLDEVKYMSSVLKQSEFSHSDLSEKDSNISVVLVYTMSLIMFACFILPLSYVLRKRLLMLMCPRNHRNVIKNEHSDNFALGEGGVMHSPIPSALD